MTAQTVPHRAEILITIAIVSALGTPALGDDGQAEDKQAQQILDTTGVRGGLIVHLGCGDGKLTAALRRGKRYLVHGLDHDPANVERAREHLRSEGVYGNVWVRPWTSDRLPYAENIVNLLVVEDAGAVSRDEMLRVLVPGGVAYWRRGGKWTKTVKPWPADTDEWTHWLHGADGNAVVQDLVVGPPRRLKWIAKPFWSRHHHTVPSVSAIVSAGGRLFYIVDEAPAGMDGSAPDKWALVARDAFNGLPLWRRPIADWGWKAWSAEWICRFTVPTHLPRRLVAVGDRVYVTLGFNAPLTELDAATGEVLRTYKGTERTDEILYHDGLLIVSVNKSDQRPGRRDKKRGGEDDDPPVRKWVAAVKADTGAMLWKTGDYVGLRSKTGSMDRISHLSMCAGDGRVFFVDGDRIVSLGLKDGRELWQTARPEVPENKMRYNIRITDMCSLVYHDGAVYFAQLNPDRGIDWREIRGRLHAFSAKTGEELWTHECASWGWGHPADVFVIDGLVWVHGYQGGPRKGKECRPRSAADLATGNSWVGSESSWVLGLDPATGEVKRKVSNFTAFNNGHHHRCYRNKATPRFLMTSFRGLEFIPLDGDQAQLNHWVRGTCRLGAIPCNGLVYATPHPCDCYITSKLNGFLALAPEPKAESGKQKAEENSARLQRGPAYGSQSQLSAFGSQLSKDWPTYRHDPERSGATESPLPADLKKTWESDVGGTPSSPVSVGNRVFLAVPASHQVLALDARNGKPLWAFTAGGRVDTPPTIDRGRAYFGCTDGWVYCLRASDGKLAWRFRGAPEDRLVGAFGGIESAWPIHGSVLVRDGIVYFTAGRSSFLDGGIVACSLDAGSGKLLSEQRLTTPHTMKVDMGRDQSADTGLLSDILVGHGGAIYMRRHKLFSAADEKKKGGPLRSTAGLLDDSWSSRTRWHLNDRPYAEYLVFDSGSIYGVRARDAMSGYVGFFAPGAAGYELFAADLSPPAGEDAGKENAGKKGKPASKKKRGLQKRWSVRVPVRITSMALAGKTLFVAGTPDVIDPVEPWAAYEGKRGGLLLAISAADGKTLARYELDAPPVLDGLAAANGKLFLSTADGSVRCFAGVR